MNCNSRTFLTCVVGIILQVLSAQSPIEDHYFFTSDKVKLHYLESSNDNDLTLLFIPGFLCPAMIWEYQLHYFQNKYHVVALDPRSHGQSDKPSDGHYLFRRSLDIHELIKHLDPKKVVVIGWSLGALETLTLVKENDLDCIKAIVLVDMYIGLDEPARVQHPSEPFWSAWMRGIQQDRINWTNNWIRRFYQNEKPESYFETLTEILMQTPTNSAVTLLSNLMHLEERDLRPVVDQINRPIQYILSSQSWAIDLADEARQRWPKMQIDIVNNTGHAVFADRPQAFNEVLELFLESLN